MIRTTGFRNHRFFGRQFPRMGDSGTAFFPRMGKPYIQSISVFSRLSVATRLSYGPVRRNPSAYPRINHYVRAMSLI